MTPHGSVADLKDFSIGAAAALPSRKPAATQGGRAFLFLQGPISPFFDRLGRTLIARGHRVHRVTLHLGDELFWRLPFTRYRGRFEDWRGFVGRLIDEYRITDLILHGDRRPYHVVAGEEARARGVAVLCTDLGYLRPNWITLEHDGMSTYSRFPRDPAAIRALAEAFPPPDLEGGSGAPFPLIAGFDVAYNLAQVFGRPLYPHYRRYGLYHPFVEYAGWLAALPLRRMRRPAMNTAKARLETEPGSYFLFPLQLATDYQIRAHSPFADTKESVRFVIDSFALSGSQRRLVAVIHPLDNGLIAWRRLIDERARAAGVADKVTVLDGGTPAAVLANAAGVVTVNSTVGLTALRLGVPVKVLGQAVFDVPGLTCQAGLDAFWGDPRPPDRDLLDAVVRALVGTTQIRGGYYERRTQEDAAAAAAARLEAGFYPLPALSPGTLAARANSPGARAPSRQIAITGVSGEIGRAVARAFAEPGSSLFLIGSDAERLENAAQDCRLRGALVATTCVPAEDRSALAGRLEERDRTVPLDLLIAAVEPTAEPSLVASAAEILAERMRRRRRGTIVLPDPPPDTTRPSLAAYADGLRRRLRPANVDVVFVGWGRGGQQLLAGRARLGMPPLPVDPERIAAQIRRVLASGRPRAVYPSRLTFARHALRLLPALVAARVRRIWPTEKPAIAAFGEEPALSREPAGD